MACENCDYTDTIMPIDYTLASFQYANRKQYHQWKMIGIQATHTFLYNGTNGNGIGLDDSGRLVGIISGCKPIEEVNQNNHILGRGAWYFRGKSDDSVGKSAGYGVLGHCQSPGIEGNQGDATYNLKPSAFTIEGYGGLNSNKDPYPSLLQNGAFPRGWGQYQSNTLCQAASASDWHMAVFFEYTVGYTGKLETFMLYYPDADCAKECGSDIKCICICKARNSQLPGRFSAWICLDDLSNKVYRTCEAFIYRIGGVERGYDIQHASAHCLDAKNSIFSSNDILGISSENILNDPAYAPFRILGIGDGVMAKLTSLPACNHFEKLIRVKKDITNNQNLIDICTENPDDERCYDRKRCERAAIRLAPQCFAGIAGGAVTATKYFHYETIEKHYDRWDTSEKGYKIFDEIYKLSNGVTARVVAHHKDELMKYWGDGVFREAYTKDKWMIKKYLTGGLTTNDPTGKKGCSCDNSSSGQDTPYPIRPYNSWTYCPNDFKCEKDCTGTAD
jgi:hypothetical protein